MLDLAEIIDKTALSEEYKRIAQKVFESLSNPPCFAGIEEQPILNFAQYGDEDTGAIWGDYFYVELLMRILHKEQNAMFW